MPQAIKGFSGLGALKKGAAWGTAVEAGAGNGFEFTANNIAGDRTVIPQTQINGTASTRIGDAGLYTVSGSYVCEPAFETVVYPLAYHLGTAGAPVLSDTVYTHSLRMADDIFGKYATLAFKHSTIEVYEYPSAKFGGFDLAFSSTGPATITHNVMCNLVNYNSTTGTNKNSTITAVTLPTSRARCLGNAMTFYMNAQAGADFAAGDKVSIVSGNISFSRNLTAKHSTLGGTQIDEPEPSGFVSVTGSFAMPRYDSEAIAARVLAFAKGAVKGKLIFVGPVAGGTTTYALTVWLNSMQLTGEPRLTGPGADEVTFTFEAHEPTAVATGFPANLDEPIGIDIVNTLASDVFA